MTVVLVNKYLVSLFVCFLNHIILNLGQGQTSNKFKKEAYVFPDGKVLLHYIGDHELSTIRPHGNSGKQTKLYVRTKPSVFKKIQTQVQTQDPHKVYKQAVSNVTIPTDTENVEREKIYENPITGVPRNVKQVQNIKNKVNTQQRLTRDAIMHMK